MVSLSPKGMMKKLLSLAAGVAGAGILLAPLVLAPKANAGYYERTPGSWACKNSLDPQCENPERNIADSWAAKNNPGPEYSEPPRIDAKLAKGSWVCRNNQNTPSCGNPLRYSIPSSDRENWPTYFPQSGQ
jgi:hypothetical protein